MMKSQCVKTSFCDSEWRYHLSCVWETSFAPQIGWDSLVYENLQRSFSMSEYISQTESIKKLSNFNFQQTKTLYQNILKHNLL